MVPVVLVALCVMVPQMQDAWSTIAKFWRPLVVTSSCHGDHMVGSAHYDNRALDFRIWHIPERERPARAEALSEALGDEYDVILEATHLHVEFDPK